MPDYKFHEIVKTGKSSVTKTMEFNLSSCIKGGSCTQSAKSFKARPMPDFRRLQSLAPVSEFKMLTECQPFKLTTEARGTEKQSIMSQKQI